MLMSFSEQIIKEAQKYLKLQLKKKFLVQIADGTLEKKDLIIG
jgi:thiaminase|tara:strand:- start:20 stop:148 length:129 start_codon:yes stop_codon:yes gene_type:complete